MSREFQLQKKSQSVPTLACKGLLQRRAANEHAQETVPPIVHEVLRSPGQPLNQETRNVFETRFGHDFSHVRVHADAPAAESAQAISALAYTMGRDVVFGAGQYTPGIWEGQRLIAHELSHVVQNRGSPPQTDTIRHPNESSQVSEAVSEHPLNEGIFSIYRKSKVESSSREQERQDVAVIVGRPSRTIPGREDREEKSQMEAWRAAARAIAPNVLEGLAVDQAFSGLRKLKMPIGKLYIIGHADSSGIGEVNAKGESVSTTVEDLTKRMRSATGDLGERKPKAVEILSCFGGGSPETMAKIGEAVGAAKARAPVWTTVILARTIILNNKRLTVQDLKAISDAKLAEYIRKIDVLKYYDFVAGVPHPQPSPSIDEKLNALVKAMRKLGAIPLIAYNAEPGMRESVPYWKAPMEIRKRTEKLSDLEMLGAKGVIEVNVNDQEKQR